MAKSQEPSKIKGIGLSLVVHAIFLSLLFVGFNAANEKIAPVVNLSKDPQPKKELVKATMVDRKAVEQAFQRQAQEEKQRQEKILAEARKAEELKQEAEQAKEALARANAEKAQVEAAAKKAEQQKALLEKQKQQVKKEIEQQNTIAKALAAKAAEAKKLEAKKAADAKVAEAKKLADQQAALKAQRDKIQAEQAAYIESEVQRYIAEIKATVEENRILSSVFKGDIQCKLRIRLTREGGILSVNVEQSSGNRAYDQMAESAVHKSAPFFMPEDEDINVQLRDIVLSFKNGEQSGNG